jgi:hypothetical protein
MGKTIAALQRERLSEMLTNKQAILVCGSGITVQATNAETASWAGLLESEQAMSNRLVVAADASDVPQHRFAASGRRAKRSDAAPLAAVPGPPADAGYGEPATRALD